MKTGLNIGELIDEVQRRAAARLDMIVNTEQALRMVEMPGYPDNVALVVLEGDSTELQRFSITEHAHRQIATWLSIPWTYYKRLLNDHRDLVLTQVNTLFEREPGVRMARTLDGKCRAFLSNKYKRLDNDVILAQTLPMLYGKDSKLPAHKVLASHIDDDNMKIRVVWTDESLAQDIGPAPRSVRGEVRDVVRPGFEIGNGETGKSSLYTRGFFYRDYCDNGCVFGIGDNAIEFRRTHIGGKLKTAGAEILSEDTMRKDDAAILAVMGDIMAALGSREFVQKMGDSLRALRTGETIKNPVPAVQVLGKQVGLRENELDRVVHNLIEDGDLSRWGTLNAVTKVANGDDVTQERAFELEEIGSSLMTMSLNEWAKIANAERVALAA